MSITEIKQNLLNKLPSYRECFTSWLGDGVAYNELDSLLKSSTADNAIFYAYNKYGILPTNPGSPGNYNQCSSYVAYLYNFLITVKYYLRYANINLEDNKNCKVIDEQIKAIEAEKLNADKQFVADQNRYRHSSTMLVLNDLQGTLQGAYSNMSCANVINQIKQQETIATITAATNESEAATTGSSTNKTIYIIAAIVVVVIIIKIFKS